jgi:hypothetical protein
MAIILEKISLELEPELSGSLLFWQSQSLELFGSNLVLEPELEPNVFWSQSSL